MGPCKPVRIPNVAWFAAITRRVTVLVVDASAGELVTPNCPVPHGAFLFRRYIEAAATHVNQRHGTDAARQPRNSSLSATA
jgi:hypothetical protein